MLRLDRGGYFVILVYTVLTGLLALAAPLAAQALVNWYLLSTRDRLAPT